MQHAKYWKYTGNHLNGRDCERHNPYGYPLDLVAWVCYKIELGEVSGKVIKKKGDNFGHEVEVIAEKEDWEKEWVLLAHERGRQLSSDWGIKSIKEEGGSLWAVSEHDEIVCELFEVSENETLLEQVQSGYGILEKYLYVCDSIKKI
jgi:hypothetical protein